MRTILAAMILGLALAGPSSAEEFFEGIDYRLLDPPVRTGTGDKVEVLELFWYGCPHCFNFEPYVQQWKQEGMPEYVELVLRPSVLNPSWGVHARAFYTAKSLGVLDEIHQPMFKAIHVERRSLGSREQLAAFFAEHGVDPEDFDRAFESFDVNTRMRKAMRTERSYEVTGVPSVIVNGRYVVSAQNAGSNRRMIEIVKHLADKAHEDMKLRSAAVQPAEGQ